MVKCVICDRKPTSREGVYNFEQLLRGLGFEGRAAHPSCVALEQRAAEARRKKYGKDVPRAIQM